MTDLEILARIVWAEAESEILGGKIAVAASIINQAQEENKTYYEVVSAPGQFEAFANQRFWQAPYQSRTPMMVEAKQAASRAVQGEDPTYRKTHFCAYRKNPCRWHWSQTPPHQYIGNHVFIRARVY